MPHNVTTEMDLALWRLASAAAASTATCCCTPRPPSSPRGTAPASCPRSGSASSCARYGHRGAAEVDVGVPRWAEDPTPGVRRDRRLPARRPIRSRPRTGASPARPQEAVAKIDELVARARRTRPIRARCAGFLLRRSRALAGLRELPKFAWLYAFAEMRRQLLAAGAELAERGLLERADDIMFLDFREALAAADGDDLRELVAARRADHERETKRRQRPRPPAVRRDRSRSR